MKVKKNKEEIMTHQQIDKLHKMIPSKNKIEKRYQQQVIEKSSMLDQQFGSIDLKQLAELKNWQENLGSKDTIATFLKRIALQNEAKNDKTPSGSLSNSSSFKLSANFSQKNMAIQQASCFQVGTEQSSNNIAASSNMGFAGNIKQEVNNSNEEHQRQLKNNWVNVEQPLQLQIDTAGNNERSLSQRTIDIESTKTKKEKSHLKTNFQSFGPFDAPPNSASMASMPVSSKASNQIHMPKGILSMLYSKDQNRTKVTMPNFKGIELQKPINQQTQQQLFYELDSQPIPASQMFTSSAGFNTSGHSMMTLSGKNNMLANHSSNLSSSVNHHSTNSSSNMLGDAAGSVKFMSTKRLFDQRGERNNPSTNENQKQMKKSNSLQRSIGSLIGLQQASPAVVKKQQSQQSGKEYYAQQNVLKGENYGDKEGQRQSYEIKPFSASQVQQSQQSVQEGQSSSKQQLQKYQGIQQQQLLMKSSPQQQQMPQQLEQYYQQENYQLGQQKQKHEGGECKQLGQIQTEQQAILGVFNRKMEKKQKTTIEGLLSLNKRTSEENTEPTRTTVNHQQFTNSNNHNNEFLTDINANINQGYLQFKVGRKIEDTNQLKSKYVSDDISMKFFLSPTNGGYQQQQQQQQLQMSCSQSSNIIHQSQNGLQRSQGIQSQVAQQIQQLQQQQQSQYYQNLQQSQGQLAVPKQLQAQQVSSSLSQQPSQLTHKSSFKKPKTQSPTIDQQSQQYPFSMSSSSPSPAGTLTTATKIQYDHLHSSASKRENSIVKKPSALSNSQQFFTLKPKSSETHTKYVDSPLKRNGIAKTKQSAKNGLALSLQYPSSTVGGVAVSKEIRNKKQLETTLKKATNNNSPQVFTALSTTNQRRSQPDQFVLARQHDSVVNEFSTSLPADVDNKGIDIHHHQPFHRTQMSNSSSTAMTATKTDEGISRYVTQIKQSTMDQLLRNDSQPQLAVIHSQPAISTTTVLRKARIETPINLGFRYYNTSMDMHNRYHNPQDYFCMIFREHFIQTFNALKYCKSLEPIDPLVLEEKLIELPLHPKKRKTIVFDLDETLVHCNEDPTVASDIILPVTFPTGECVKIGLNIRPFAKETLFELSKFFEIIIFTASHQCYAEKVVEYLDPTRSAVDFVLSREHCVEMPNDEVYIKDLRILKNRDLKDIVLIDNAAYSFGFQIDNGIPIIPFFENKADMELKYIIDFLKKLIDKEDVRLVLQKTFKLQIYSECDVVSDALERVYGIESVNNLEVNVKQNDDDDESSIDLERYQDVDDEQGTNGQTGIQNKNEQQIQIGYQNDNSDDELDLERYEEGCSEDLEAVSINSSQEIEKALQISDL